MILLASKTMEPNVENCIFTERNLLESRIPARQALCYNINPYEQIKE